MPSMKLRQEVLKTARRIVVKVGTALLTKDGGTLDTARINGLVRQVVELRKRGCEVTIVSCRRNRRGHGPDRHEKAAPRRGQAAGPGGDRPGSPHAGL